MKILQVVHSLPFLNLAGTEIYTHRLSLELSKRHEVYIFSRVCDTRQKEYEVTQEVRDGVNIYLINNTFRACDSFEKYYNNPEIDKRFEDMLNAVKPDIVHIQHLVFLSIGLIKEANKRGIPIIFTLHDYWLICPRWHFLKKDSLPCDKEDLKRFDEECVECLGELLFITKGAKKGYFFCKKLLPGRVINVFKDLYFLFMRRMRDNSGFMFKLKDREKNMRGVLDKVDMFLAPSKYARNVFIKFGMPEQKIRVSINGAADALFMDSHKTKSEKIRFAFIGTIIPAKGLHVLIEAFNGIKDEYLELKIYGKLYSYAGFESYLPSLIKMAKNKNIKFMDEFKNEDIARIFKDIDVLVVPSIWHENAPLVIQEAFLSKTPVIASGIGGIPELINGGMNGLLFKPGDANDLRKKIEYIIDNLSLIQEFRKNMPKIKNIEENAAEIERIYADLIK